jgi:hypothetical protein
VSGRENPVGLAHVLAGYDVDVAAVMEMRHDVEPDVFVGIGNDPDNRCHPFLIAQIHDLIDIASAGEVHRLQFAKVNKQIEVWSHALKRGLNFLGVKFGFVQADVLGENDG